MAERAHPDDKSFQDRWFGLKKNPFRENLHRRYQHCLKFIEGQVVLDIPCGMGWGTSMLQGAREIHGVDISEEAIREARQRYPGIKFSVGNMTRFAADFPAAFFDLIVCLEGFEHITFLEGQAFLKNVQRALKPGGLLILSTPLLYQDQYHSGNKYHLCEYKESELIETLKEHAFSIREKSFLPTPHGNPVALLTLGYLSAS